MITFASFVPHSPILIPEVGKENLAKLKETIEAYKDLEHALYSSKPDLVIVISPHTNKGAEFFTINQQPKLKLNFKNFGDLVTKLEFDNDIGLGYQIKESCEDYFPIMLTSNKELDYGTGVPLLYLMEHLPNTKIISIGYADLPYQDHIKFGELIRKQINLADKRVAIIASGDLSHKLHKDSPAGYSDRAQEFDQTIIKLLNNNQIDDIINIDKKLVSEAGECGLRSLLILLGAIKEMNYQPEKLSYQAPFGIGYLVENFEIK
ncbi:MAG: AmmeMemoRadiSam system protein B [Candidatus Komeilibacteria bacterium]|jgi:MEMO1 family protein|nr:AmmeMemoRadiSam system protein B [Candidatus Komeilibacteria bacterium]